MKSPEQEFLNVFSGEGALLDYFNPENHPPAPLVELPCDLNPFCSDKVRVFGKIMAAVPLANVKSLPAYNMLLEALAQGRLDEVQSIYESSSGNTAFSVAVIARALGIHNINVFVSNTIAPEKLEFLKILGINVIVNKEPMCPDPDDPESGINKAKRYAKQFKGYCPSQYDNPSNPDAHYKWTGPQIFSQTQGNLQIYAATLGTTGTIFGSGRFLKEHLPNLKIVGIASAEDKVRLGPRTKNALKEISFAWQSVVDEIVEVDASEGYYQSLLLFRRGIMAGPSSGFNLAGLYKYISELKSTDSLDILRNSDGEIICVCIFPDGPLPYLSSYIGNVPHSLIPEVENPHLLDSRIHSEDVSNAVGINPIEVYELINSGRNPKIIDIRKESDYEKFRIKGAKRIDVEFLEIAGDADLSHLKDASIVIVVDCGLSDYKYSAFIASLLNRRGIKAYYMIGGMDAWARSSLPVES